MAHIRGDIRRHCIFALIEQDLDMVYIGKTCSKSLDSQRRSHMRGDVECTRDVFGPEAADPDMDYCILEILDCTIVDAYKHVLAWYRYFLENGYEIVGREKTLNDCQDLLPETQAIYDAVCAPVSLSVVFNRDVPEPETPPPPIRKPERPPGAIMQLNIRVKGDVAQAFRNYCERMNLSQSDGLTYLLSSHGPMQIPSLIQEREYYKDLMRYLQEENAVQKKSAIEHQKRDREIRCAISDFSAALINAAQENCDYYLLRPALKPKPYRRAKASENLDQYKYPTQSGCTTVALKGFAFSRGKASSNQSFTNTKAAIFVFGQTADDKIKLRWYPKKDYIGITPTDEEYAHLNSRWIMAYKIANDGAADLIAAVPLVFFEPDPVAAELLSSGLVSVGPLKPALDAQISAAAGKHEQF